MKPARKHRVCFSFKTGAIIGDCSCFKVVKKNFGWKFAPNNQKTLISKICEFVTFISGNTLRGGWGGRGNIDQIIIIKIVIRIIMTMMMIITVTIFGMHMQSIIIRFSDLSLSITFLIRVVYAVSTMGLSANSPGPFYF